VHQSDSVPGASQQVLTLGEVAADQADLAAELSAAAVEDKVPIRFAF
jgi:hypothetical protein